MTLAIHYTTKKHLWTSLPVGISEASEYFCIHNNHLDLSQNAITFSFGKDLPC